MGTGVATGTPARIEELLKTSGSYVYPDLDARDTRGYTPFMVACAGGHVDAVRMLCAAGCDCKLRNHVGLVRHVDPATHRPHYARSCCLLNTVMIISIAPVLSCVAYALLKIDCMM